MTYIREISQSRKYHVSNKRQSFIKNVKKEYDDFRASEVIETQKAPQEIVEKTEETVISETL